LEAVFGYLDNMEAASEELWQLFLRLRDHRKCIFGARTIDFMGHRVTAAGVAPLPGHEKSVTDFPKLATVKELQGSMGLINFYRQFIPAVVRIVKLLTDSQSSGGKGADRITWSPEMRCQFRGLHLNGVVKF
jgi:hypothetical protein